MDLEFVRTYEKTVQSTAAPSESFANKNEEVAYWALCMCGEAGEVANGLKKHLRHGKTMTRLEMTSELGDVLWYLTVLAERFGSITLDEIMSYNALKLAQRYPAGFSAEASLERPQEDYCS